MHDVAEIALESPHRFLLGLPAGTRICVDFLGTRVAAKLGDRHAVQHRVDATVPAAVEPVPHRIVLAFTGGRGQRGSPVEASEAALGEPTRIAHLDQELGHAARRETIEIPRAWSP